MKRPHIFSQEILPELMDAEILIMYVLIVGL